jgi:hypothetical protein
MADVKGDDLVVHEWAEKLSPLCDQPVSICETWLTAFLTAVRLSRCQHLPEETRACGHDNPMVGSRIHDCGTCRETLARREGHTEAGVFWTAGEVMELASQH